MKILVIGDTQVRPEHDLSYLELMGRYALHVRPDVIVFIGDHWDMYSLNYYTKGKLNHEGKRYNEDIEAGNEGMRAFWHAITIHNLKRKRNKKSQYTPRKIFCIGNHEERIRRVVNDNPHLEGLMGYHHFDLDCYGFEIYDYLEPVEIEGVVFCHYFPSGTMGRPTGTPQLILQKKMQSCVCGHQQGLQFATAYDAMGRRRTAIINGSSYLHDEGYLGHQGNNHWRGVVVLHNVKDGEFSPEFVDFDMMRGFLK